MIQTQKARKLEAACGPFSQGRQDWKSCCSFRFSKATRVASTTNAENVQSVPRMASSTCSMTSLGNRMDLFVVAGIGNMKWFHNDLASHEK